MILRYFDNELNHRTWVLTCFTGLIWNHPSPAGELVRIGSLAFNPKSVNLVDRIRILNLLTVRMIS
ncbi:hypothetical protein HanIR_Chr17g0850781 [Helianthus annuus]|nr:hypothetical protein HanIR_Chr17g0850781 [Helianthus annuus]